MRTCLTHHYACGCREEEFETVREENKTLRAESVALRTELDKTKLAVTAFAETAMRLLAEPEIPISDKLKLIRNMKEELRKLNE